MEEVVEGSGEDHWAVPVEKVKDGTWESEMRGLDKLGHPELEHQVNSKDYLE